MSREDIDEDVRRKARPYINSVLRDDFAIAIAKGVDSDEVMALWEMEWRKQYPKDDILILKMLSKDEDSILIKDGEWLNNIRSDHERLALSCIHGQIEIDFAKALLSGGFGKYPEAVNDVLDGGEPELIARIRKLESYENLPPGLDKKIVIPEKEPINSVKPVLRDPVLRDPPTLQSAKSGRSQRSRDVSQRPSNISEMVNDFLGGINQNAKQLKAEVDLAKNFNKTIPDRNICPVCFHEVKEKDHPICGFCSHELEGKL